MHTRSLNVCHLSLGKQITFIRIHSFSQSRWTQDNLGCVSCPRTGSCEKWRSAVDIPNLLRCVTLFRGSRYDAEKINRTYVIMFMGHKTPNCGLMDMLVKEIHLYSFMPWWVSYSWHQWKDIERLPLEGQLLKDFFDLEVNENRFLIVDQDNCTKRLPTFIKILIEV